MLCYSVTAAYTHSNAPLASTRSESQTVNNVVQQWIRPVLVPRVSTWFGPCYTKTQIMACNHGPNHIGASWAFMASKFHSLSTNTLVAQTAITVYSIFTIHHQVIQSDFLSSQCTSWHVTFTWHTCIHNCGMHWHLFTVACWPPTQCLYIYIQQCTVHISVS